jgi:hypothetical protein
MIDEFSITLSEIERRKAEQQDIAILTNWMTQLNAKRREMFKIDGSEVVEYFLEKTERLKDEFFVRVLTQIMSITTTTFMKTLDQFLDLYKLGPNETDDNLVIPTIAFEVLRNEIIEASKNVVSVLKNIETTDETLRKYHESYEFVLGATLRFMNAMQKVEEAITELKEETVQNNKDAYLKQRNKCIDGLEKASVQAIGFEKNLPLDDLKNDLKDVVRMRYQSLHKIITSVTNSNPTFSSVINVAFVYDPTQINSVRAAVETKRLTLDGVKTMFNRLSRSYHLKGTEGKDLDIEKTNENDLMSISVCDYNEKLINRPDIMFFFLANDEKVTKDVKAFINKNQVIVMNVKSHEETWKNRWFGSDAADLLKNNILKNSGFGINESVVKMSGEFYCKQTKDLLEQCSEATNEKNVLSVISKGVKLAVESRADGIGLTPKQKAVIAVLLVTFAGLTACVYSMGSAECIDFLRQGATQIFNSIYSVGSTIIKNVISRFTK